VQNSFASAIGGYEPDEVLSSSDFSVVKNKELTYSNGNLFVVNETNGQKLYVSNGVTLNPVTSNYTPATGEEFYGSGVDFVGDNVLIEVENEKGNISICKGCEKEFEPKENEEYCKNCIITSRYIGKNKFNIILQTEPEILIGTVTDKNFANELCSIGTTELSNYMNLEEVVDNLKEVIAEKRREEIREIISTLDDKSMPSVMKHFKTNYQGKVDMKLVSNIAKG
jgi:hypothetical protein